MGQTVEPVSDSLRVPVRDFVDGVTPALTELGSAEPRADVVAEAYEIVSAFVDADGTHTDEELWALIGAFSGLMDTHIHHATPADIRATGLIPQNLRGLRGQLHRQVDGQAHIGRPDDGNLRACLPNHRLPLFAQASCRQDERQFLLPAHLDD